MISWKRFTQNNSKPFPHASTQPATAPTWTSYVRTQSLFHPVVHEGVEVREGVASRIVMFGNMEETQRDCTAQQQHTDHTHWNVQGNLVSVDPTAMELYMYMPLTCMYM